METPKQILQKVKEAIRRPYSWPGGYPVYTVLSDGALLCPDCARSNYRLIADSTLHHYCDSYRDEWRAVATAILWENEPDNKKQCVHCDKELESAY